MKINASTNTNESIINYPKRIGILKPLYTRGFRLKLLYQKAIGYNFFQSNNKKFNLNTINNELIVDNSKHQKNIRNNNYFFSYKLGINKTDKKNNNFIPIYQLYKNFKEIPKKTLFKKSNSLIKFEQKKANQNILALRKNKLLFRPKSNNIDKKNYHNLYSFDKVDIFNKIFKYPSIKKNSINKNHYYSYSKKCINKNPIL